MMRIPKGVVVIDCKSIEFAGKDIVILRRWEDFVFMLSGTLVIYKLRNVYYNIAGEVAWLYEEDKTK